MLTYRKQFLRTVSTALVLAVAVVLALPAQARHRAKQQRIQTHSVNTRHRAHRTTTKSATRSASKPQTKKSTDRLHARSARRSSK